MSKLATLISLGIRVGAVGGTVYVLNDIGAFGDIKQGEKALATIKSTKLEDLVGKEISDQIPAIEIPQEITSTLSTVTNTTSDFAKDFPSYWNCGVKTTFAAASELPDTSKHYLNVAVEEVKKSMN